MGEPGQFQGTRLVPDLIAGSPSTYLAPDDIVESDSPAIIALTESLRARRTTDIEVAEAAYHWVRDEVAHSLDAQDPRVTLTATEVLRERVGLCFAKSHLLAAVLRAAGIPTGLCYQRLSDGDGHVLHGLVAVHLAGRWHRLDPRGNRPGLHAAFSLGQERLAYAVDPGLGEIDHPQVFVTPVPEVVSALRDATDVLALCVSGLPSDLALTT